METFHLKALHIPEYRVFSLLRKWHKWKRVFHLLLQLNNAYFSLLRKWHKYNYQFATTMTDSVINSERRHKERHFIEEC